MNVYFDNIIFSLQPHGGISVVWYELLRRALFDPDLECNFIDSPNPNFLRQDLDIPCDSILKNNLSNFPLKIQRYINPRISEKKGIFHSSYFRTVNDTNIINITTVHDFTYEHYVKGLPKLIHHHQKGNAIKNSNKIICVSENTKLDLLSFYPKINEDSIEVVYNGVSKDYFPLSTEDNEPLKQLIIFQQKEFVLYVGDRRSNYKNFAMLVDACSLSKVPLVIVGGGMLTAIEASILNVKLGKTMYQKLGGISNPELNILYNNALFLVYPSIYEGFGIPILEAQKAGCPVICSNKSSIPEVAGNGAFILDNISAKGIAEIIRINKSNSSVTNTLIDKGFINAQRFSWDNCYKQTKQIYIDLNTLYF